MSNWREIRWVAVLLALLRTRKRGRERIVRSSAGKQPGGHGLCSGATGLLISRDCGYNNIFDMAARDGSDAPNWPFSEFILDHRFEANLGTTARLVCLFAEDSILATNTGTEVSAVRFDN